MGEDTKIEWAHHTFNPWMGCTKVSAGCQYCYAENMMDLRWRKVKWGPQGTRKRTSVANWRKPIQWNKDAGEMGVRFRVFCASLADVFEDRDELIPWREDLLYLIQTTPHLDWMLLTKRPENIMKLWPGGYKMMKNVWLGTSVENAEVLPARLEPLCEVPAIIRFVSCEPLLGPLLKLHIYLRDIQLVIVGGESGSDARPFDCDWARVIREICAGNSSFFMKQLGARPLNEGKPYRMADPKGGNILGFPTDLQVREIPEVVWS